MTAPRAVLRLFVGVVAFAALLLIFVITVGGVRDASETRDISAVQAIQLYAEGLFYSVTVVGMAIAVYIGSRADER